MLLLGAAFEPAVAGPDMIAEGTEPLRQGANPRGQHDEAPNVASRCGDPEIDWGMFKSYFDVIRQSIEHKRYDYAGRPQEGCVLTMLVEARRWAQAGGLLVRMYDRDRVEVGLSPSDWTPDFNARGWSPGERARVVVPLEPGPSCCSSWNIGRANADPLPAVLGRAPSAAGVPVACAREGLGLCRSRGGCMSTTFLVFELLVALGDFDEFTTCASPILVSGRDNSGAGGTCARVRYGGCPVPHATLGSIPLERLRIG